MATTSDPRTETRFTTTLDEFEERLPGLPAAMLRFERALVGRTVDLAAGAAGNVKRSVSEVNSKTGHSAKVVAGTARRAVETTVSAARTGVNSTTGQSRAQLRRVGQTVETEVSDNYDAAVGTVASATEAIDPDDDATTGYDRWTKAELYEKATEMEITGRSDMSKAELLEAIRAH